MRILQAFFQDEGFCKGECCLGGCNKWSTDNACLSYKPKKRKKIRVVEKPLKNCLTIQVSEKDVDIPDFDLVNYLDKKIKKAWFKKAQEFYLKQNHFPFNNVKEL